MALRCAGASLQCLLAGHGSWGFGGPACCWRMFEGQDSLKGGVGSIRASSEKYWCPHLCTARLTSSASLPHTNPPCDPDPGGRQIDRQLGEPGRQGQGLTEDGKGGLLMERPASC